MTVEKKTRSKVIEIPPSRVRLSKNVKYANEIHKAGTEIYVNQEEAKEIEKMGVGVVLDA